MPVTTCPHCEEGIDSLTRTGDKKYSCGKCNMVIKYDDVQPHLDEMEVIDKRGQGGSDGGNSDSGNSGNSQPQQPSQGGSQQVDQAPPSDMGGGAALSEREKIYQRGTDGLREIKKERLKDWLSKTEGVGAQTESRIMMVFDRNDSVHKNPHVLYNFLDDQIGANASYLNTMVQDIFEPEEQYSDLLTSQGYTPWHTRANQQNMGQQNMGQQNMGQGGPMNATGATNFNPNQQNQNQHQQQQNQGQQGQQQQGQQGQQGSPGDDSISREEAEMMMRQATAQANQQDQRGALMSGLSDGANKAIEEMASNAGGLFGTVQRVIDEALVEYARENPEWVIENMDILQNILGATDGSSGNSGGGNTQQSQEDQKVDNALENLGNNQQGGQDPSRNTQNSQQTNHQPQQQQNSQQQMNNTAPSTQDTTTQEPNPDLDDELMSESGFEPDYDTDNFGAEEQPSEPEPNNSEPEANTSPQQNAEPEQTDQHTEDDEEQEDGFDDIFGDIAED